MPNISTRWWKKKNSVLDNSFQLPDRFFHKVFLLYSHTTMLYNLCMQFVWFERYWNCFKTVTGIALRHYVYEYIWILNPSTTWQWYENHKCIFSHNLVSRSIRSFLSIQAEKQELRCFSVQVKSSPIISV